MDELRIPDELQLKIATLVLGLRAEWIPVEEAIRWADRMIEAEEQPHPALVDISLAAKGDQYELARALETIFRDRPPAVPEAYLLGAMESVLSRHPERGRAIASHLWSFSHQRENEERPGVVHDLALPHYWYGEAADEPENYSVDEALNMLRAALAPYRFQSGDAFLLPTESNP